MAAPTFVQEAETVFNDATSPKTSPAITDSTGDVLVSCGVAESGSVTSITPTLTGETFTSKANIGTAGGSCRVHALTAVIASSGAAETVSLARAGTTTLWWGANQLLFTASNGVGAANSAENTSSAAPNLALTTTQDNSAIVVILADFGSSDPATWAWRTINGSAPTIQTSFLDSVHYSFAIGYYPDAGVAGAKSVGTTTAMVYTIAAIEVKGSAGAAPAVVLPRTFNAIPFMGGVL
jgi:hypothetical protein